MYDIQSRTHWDITTQTCVAQQTKSFTFRARRLTLLIHFSQFAFCCIIDPIRFRYSQLEPLFIVVFLTDENRIWTRKKNGVDVLEWTKWFISIFFLFRQTNLNHANCNEMFIFHFYRTSNNFYFKNRKLFNVQARAQQN